MKNSNNIPNNDTLVPSTCKYLFCWEFVVKKKSGANEISNVWITKRNRLMLLPNCAICGKKKSTFIKSRTFKWLV